MSKQQRSTTVNQPAERDEMDTGMQGSQQGLVGTNSTTERDETDTVRHGSERDPNGTNSTVRRDEGSIQGLETRIRDVEDVLKEHDLNMKLFEDKDTLGESIRLEHLS